MRIRTRPLLRGSIELEEGDEDDSVVTFVDVEPLFETIKQQFFRVDRKNSRSALSGSGDTSDDYPWSALEDEFPSATPSECQRFWNQYGPKHSAEHLSAYLEWRALYEPYSKVSTSSRSLGRSLSSLGNGHGSTTSQLNINLPPPEHRDADEWEQSWEIAWYQVERCQQHPDEVVLFPNAITKHHKGTGTSGLSKFKMTPIPQYVFCHYIPEQHGSNNLLLQVLPAQIDVSQANAEIHSLAVSLYLYDLFSEHDTPDQLATADLWLDVRGAPPWANPKPLQLLPLIRTMSARLLSIHPERLHRLIVFPLPGWAVTIYKIISGVLPQVVRERTILVAGSDKHTVPPPLQAMAKHLEHDGKHDTLHDMERVRKQAVTKAEQLREQMRTTVKL